MTFSLPNTRNNIRSKFPKEAFELLNDAYDHGSFELIEEHRRTFICGIRNCAQDISSKYIDAPNSTDFAIRCVPFERRCAQVPRTPGFFESIKREYNVVINGPTTLAAYFSSLQIGFRIRLRRTIEKRSSEVWQLLSVVKTEFGNFAGLLDKAQKNM